MDPTLSQLKNLEDFYFEIDNSHKEKEALVIRCKIKTPEEAENFIDGLQRKTQTKFVLFYTNYNPKRLVFHKKWICRLSSVRKRPLSKINLGCGAFVDVMIKKVTQNTIRRDRFLKSEDPLPCVITLNLDHTHVLQSAESLRTLSVLPETIQQFEEYFGSGMTPSEARSLHETRLLAEGDSRCLANASLNPTDAQLYYLHDKWRNEHFISMFDPFLKLEERIKDFENEGYSLPSEENSFEIATAEDKEKFLQVLHRLLNFNIKKKVLQNITSNLKQVRSEEEFNQKLFKIQAALNFQRKIKVQPTSISRRRPGTKRGRNPVPAGRPLLRQKRKHSLKLNVLKNKPNSKY